MIYENAKINRFIEKPITLLILLYFVSVVTKVLLSLYVKAPYIYLDELIYTKMAQSFFDSGEFLYKGIPTHQYPPLYPIVISAAFILKDMAAIYIALKIINALISSLIIIPVWLLSRNFLNEKESITLAIYSLIFPYSIYSNVIMSENLFYPLFMFTIYLIYESTIKDNFKIDVLCGFSIGLLSLTKITGNFLLITFVFVLLIEIIIKIKNKEKNEPLFKCYKNITKFSVFFIKHVLMAIKKKWGVFLAYALIVSPWFIRNGYHFGYSLQGMLGGYFTEIEAIETIQFSFGSFIYFVFTHFSYLIIASGIIFFASSIMLLHSFLNNELTSTKSNNILIFTTISWVSSFLLVIMSSYHVYQAYILIDDYHRIQGRYIDPILLLFLMMGFIGLKQGNIARNFDFFGKYLLPSLLISSFVLVFSPLSFLHAQAITSTPGILFLNIFEVLNVPIVIAKSFLVVLPFTFLLLYRFGLLRIKYIVPIFAIFLLCSSSVAYAYNVNMSYWIENDMEIGKWLYSNDKRESVVLFDGRDSDKSHIVQWGIEFWTNDKIIVGDAIPGKFKFDFGRPKSPVAPGYIQITAPFTNSTEYKHRIGFGWLTAYHVDARDMGLPDDLHRDFIMGHANNTFKVDLPNDSYYGTVVIGRNDVDVGPMSVKVENMTILNSESIKKGDIISKKFKVTVSDGQMDIEFEGDWIINSLSLQKVDAKNYTVDYILSSREMSYQKVVSNNKWRLYDLHSLD